MNVLFIDDDILFAKAIYKKLNNNQLDSEINNEPLVIIPEINEELSDLSKRVIADRDDIIFININLKIGNNTRQLQKGIELLIWLRVNEIMNHVVLYSFESLHSLLNRKPQHLIATSVGTSFVQLPDDFSKIKPDKLANKEILKVHLKPAFVIDKIRHLEANWWGIKRLWDVQRLLLNKSLKDFNYPSGVLSQNKDLNSCLGVFLYGINDKSLGQALDQTALIKAGSIETDKTLRRAFKEFHRNISNIKPKILHIDDQWSDGWGEIFCKMIYGEAEYSLPNIDQKGIYNWNDFLFSFKPSDDNLSALRTNESTFIDNLKLNEFDLIILDLRLDPIIDEQKNLHEISGAIMLSEIRNRIKGIPILITTASNKVWSYEELMKLGADAYWMKEGIDNLYTAKNSAKNYYKLIMLFDLMTSERYKSLKYFESKTNAVKDNAKWFKSNITWKNNDTIKLNDENINCIYELLEDGILMLRTFLHQSFLGNSYCLSKIDSYWLTAIINKLGGIVEEIHFPGKPGFDSSIVGGKWGQNSTTKKWDWMKMNRQDWIAFILLNFRNAASHNKNGKELNDIEIVELFIKLLLYWLNMENYQQFKNPKTINNSNWDKIKKYTNEFISDNQIAFL
jgi:CheY-like chemotaxis protein